MSQPDLPNFEAYPDTILVAPGEDPAKLLRLLAGFDQSVAGAAARACVDNEAWTQLQAMVDGGFPIAECTTDGKGDLRIEETLLHRCVRMHLYDNLPDRLERLLAMGADPHAHSGQGITVLGLLMAQAQAMPNKTVIQSFQVLSEHGVRMSDPCHQHHGLAHFLLDSQQAMQIIADRCPELVGWARAVVQQEKLSISTTAPDVASGAHVGVRRL